jgi:phage baseplate assembly protein W
MTDIPHFTLPFRFDAGGVGPTAVVAEQDTTDEIMSCVLAVLLCPRGFRAELPDFGIEDPTFSQGAVDHEPIAAALAEWEPRAHSVVTTRLDAMDELIDHVLVSLGVPSGD